MGVKGLRNINFGLKNAVLELTLFLYKYCFGMTRNRINTLALCFLIKEIHAWQFVSYGIDQQLKDEGFSQWLWHVITLVFKLSVLKQASFMWWWEMFWRQISLTLMCAWLIFHTRYLHWACLIYLLQCCDCVYTFSCFAIYISQISSPFVFKLLLHRPFFRYTYFLFVNSNTNVVYVWL